MTKIPTNNPENGEAEQPPDGQQCSYPFVQSDERGIYKVISDVTEEHILEMANQLLKKKFERGARLSDPKVVSRYLAIRFANAEREIFCCIFLDNRHCVIACEDLFLGTIDGASVYSREVVKRALELNAAAVIFAHNHPSANAEPSSADQRLTQQLIKALQVVDIRVLDHFVIGGHEAVSFAERGLL